MQNEQEVKIVERFFEVIYDLKKRRQIGGKTTIARDLGINRRNFWQLEQDKTRDILRIGWISHLITKYSVSAEWIMTGQGDMYVEEPPYQRRFKQKKKE